MKLESFTPQQHNNQEKVDYVSELKKFSSDSSYKLIDYIQEKDPQFLESVFTSTKDLREVALKLSEREEDSLDGLLQEEFPFKGKNELRSSVYLSEANLAHFELLLSKYSDLETGKSLDDTSLFRKIIIMKAQFDGKIAKLKEAPKFIGDDIRSKIQNLKEWFSGNSLE